ncbi:hypothetical protein Hanom_Chr12g01111651 [Helianthus anomalus]
MITKTPYLWVLCCVLDDNALFTNNSMYYVDYHVVFYIHSSTMVCLKFLWTVRVWILCFSHPHSVIYGF